MAAIGGSGGNASAGLAAAAGVLLAAALLAVVLHAGPAAALQAGLPAAARPPAGSRDVIVALPRAFKPEGIAADGAGGFFSGSLNGRVWHHDLATGSSAEVEGSDVGAFLLQLTGLKFCPIQKALFMAGSMHGKAYVMRLEERGRSARGAPRYRVREKFAIDVGFGAYLNDVALGADTVWFTDSSLPRLYALPRFKRGPVTKADVAAYELGPEFLPLGPMFSANGAVVVDEAPGGKALGASGNGSSAGGGAGGDAGGGNVTLVLAQWAKGDLYRVVVDRAAGRAAAVDKIKLAGLGTGGLEHIGADGLALDGSGRLWVGDNLNDQVLQVELGEGTATGRVACRVKSPSFNGVSTVAFIGGRLWATNSHFRDCGLFSACEGTDFEVVGIEPAAYGCLT